MTVPEWDDGIDDHGIHRAIEDETLSKALPHEDADTIDGYHEKYVAPSKGKLVVQGKDKKMRRTALGEGLFKDQKKLSTAVRKFNGARLMKRVAGTKARISSAGNIVPVADGPSPQNTNTVRRSVTSNEIHLDPGDPIQVPGNVVRKVENRFLATVSDGAEPSSDPNETQRTICFVTHGVISIACDAALRKQMRIGDTVYVANSKAKFGMSDVGITFSTGGYPEQFIVTSDQRVGNKIGTYLGPSCDRPNGGIVVRLNLNH